MGNRQPAIGNRKEAQRGLPVLRLPVAGYRVPSQGT
jgi:hypothetical protein